MLTPKNSLDAALRQGVWFGAVPLLVARRNGNNSAIGIVILDVPHANDFASQDQHTLPPDLRRRHPAPQNRRPGQVLISSENLYQDLEVSMPLPFPLFRTKAQRLRIPTSLASHPPSRAQIMQSILLSTFAATAILHRRVLCVALPDDTPEIEVPQQTTMPDPVRSSNDNTCNFFQKQIRDPQDSDNLIWVEASPDVSLNQCTEVCGDAVAKNVEAGEVASFSCIHYSGEMDWQPYYGKSEDHFYCCIATKCPRTECSYFFRIRFGH